jgi:glycosyltransferase involved in cell wall biosynthesis
MKRGYNVTIALLTYNRCEKGFLKQALEAILAQTYKDFELLVLDNHSTDATAEFIMRYEDPRLTYVRLPAGGNATSSYIRSALMSRGEYLIFAHDDDIMEPTMIERQLEWTRTHPECLVVSNNVSLINESSELIQRKLYDLDKDLLFEKGEYIRRYMEEKIWMPAPTLLFRRKPYVKAVSRWLGTRDPGYLASGDIWILFTLNLQGSIALMADPLLRYRQHAGQESRNVDQGYPMIEAIRLLLKNQGRNKSLSPHLPAIHAYLARFGAQNVCFQSRTRGRLVQGITRLKKKWERAVDPRERALDMVLPFEILLHLLGLAPTLKAEDLAVLFKEPAKGGGRRGFRSWLKALLRGENLFHFAPPLKRIGILGSMLNAYLIAESARQAGVEVKGCFDSSPSRINRQVLDIPIFPIGDLAARGKELEAIVLSSEHDQEDALRKILEKHMPEKNDLPILSWKEMACRASSRGECI